MSKKQIKTLKVLLHKAETTIIDKINEAAPSDKVPDRIAMPILNRLELAQIQTEDTFCNLRMILKSYLE